MFLPVKREFFLFHCASRWVQSLGFSPCEAPREIFYCRRCYAKIKWMREREREREREMVSVVFIKFGNFLSSTNVFWFSLSHMSVFKLQLFSLIETSLFGSSNLVFFCFYLYLPPCMWHYPGDRMTVREKIRAPACLCFKNVYILSGPGLGHIELLACLQMPPAVRK